MNLKKQFDGEKLHIHMFYWIVILVLTIVVLFTTKAYLNQNLSNMIAFGATLSGIILSVIAIMITLIGETKSDNTKDKLLNLSNDLEHIVNDIKNTTNNLENLVKFNIEVKKGINEINCAMNQIIDSSKDENLNEKDIEKTQYYLEIFKLFIKNQSEMLKKPVFVIFTYVCLWKNNSMGKLCYETYMKDAGDLIFGEINNGKGERLLSSIWGMVFVFSGAFKLKEFNDYIQNYTKTNYMDNYNKIIMKFK